MGSAVLIQGVFIINIGYRITFNGNYLIIFVIANPQIVFAFFTFWFIALKQFNDYIYRKWFIIKMNVYN